jgi:glycosyltransferase involved in cell wall biosynthesis
MRILIATTHRAVVGGVETYLRELLPRLAARGHALALLHERDADGAACVDEGLPNVPRWLLADGAGLRAAADWGSDICYSQCLESPAAEEALLGRFPVALFAHNYHGTCVSGTKRHALPRPRPCGRTLGAACLLMYFPRRCGGLNPRTMLRQYRLQRRRENLLPRYRAVLVASRHMRAEYLRHGVAEDRLHLAPLFPPGQLPDSSPPAERPFTGRLLMIGRLTDLKGGRLLVKALPRACAALGRPLHLTVAGDGPERAALAALARRRGVGIEFAGWVDAARRAELMRQADLLAVPSVWPEPFGMVGLEAGCVGLPAVGYAVGGIPDWLLPGESGELAPGDPPTVQGLTDALVRALADPRHLHRLREGAWCVARRFTPERHLDALESVLARAAGAAAAATVPAHS